MFLVSYPKNGCYIRCYYSILTRGGSFTWYFLIVSFFDHIFYSFALIIIIIFIGSFYLIILLSEVHSELTLGFFFLNSGLLLDNSVSHTHQAGQNNSNSNKPQLHSQGKKRKLLSLAFLTIKVNLVNFNIIWS